MENQEKLIRQLTEKVEQLTRLQHTLSDELRAVQRSLVELKKDAQTQAPASVSTKIVETHAPQEPVITPPAVIPPPKPVEIHQAQKVKPRTPLEEFVGTNLLNKIGIAILVIGIGFGVKYAIDHQLVTPLMRVINGYVSGIVLILIALRLKKRMEAFSAVLLSGGMAVLYFITFAAYEFYELIPRITAFGLMVIFTAFTVFASLQYNLQVIAIIGMVGAYAVPFLLNNNSGRIDMLYAYMTIINSGILILAFRKSWKLLYRLAFVLTWLVVISWRIIDFSYEHHFWICLIFSTVFFLTFHIVFLAFKLLQKEPLSRSDIFYTLLNSFLYYIIGYFTLDSRASEQYLGLFTVFLAVLHFTSGIIVLKQRERQNDIFYFIAGMVLVFLTIAVPVQLDGHWVTLIWIAEAALLFWIGRTKGFAAYEKLAYPLIVLAFISLMQDWEGHYNNWNYYYDNLPSFTFLLNIQFFSSLWVVGILAFIYYIHRNPVFKTVFAPDSLGQKMLNYGLPAMIMIVLFFAVYLEINSFWNYRYLNSRVSNPAKDLYFFNESLLSFKTLWLINYTAAFAGIVSVVSIWYSSIRQLRWVALALNTVVVVTFLSTGLLALLSLRESFITQDMTQYYFRDHYHIVIRYISLLFITPLLWLSYKLIKTDSFDQQTHIIERVVFHIAMIILLSSELLHWLDLAHVKDSYKLALSILLGLYALGLIVVGIIRSQQYSRILGIVLFGITLLKLFFYDIADMGTIAKTLVMIILGVLLLIASYLYNRFKDKLKNEQN